MEEITTQSEALDSKDDLKPYKVDLESFQGPLDLLLHLIKKNELDIHDISVASITEQYLDYLDMMKTLNLEVAGEYLVMAATLAHIKSRGLLPEDAVQEPDDQDDEDPEEALKKRLLEYQKFKEAGERFHDHAWLGKDVFTRDEELPTVTSDELQPVSLFKLVELFYQRLKHLPKVLEHEVMLERISVAERIQEINQRLDRLENKSVDFYELLEESITRYDVIVTFLALLEMVRVNLLRVAQADVFSPIVVTKIDSSVENP